MNAMNSLQPVYTSNKPQLPKRLNLSHSIDTHVRLRRWSAMVGALAQQLRN